jgi:hypothetical protein
MLTFHKPFCETIFAPPNHDRKSNKCIFQPSDNSLNGLSIIQLQTTPGPQTVDFSHIILNSGHDLKERKKVWVIPS